MIWLNRKLIEKFLTRLLTKKSPELDMYGICYTDEFFDSDEQESDDDYEDSDDEEQRQCPIIYKQNLVIDFTDWNV